MFSLIKKKIKHQSSIKKNSMENFNRKYLSSRSVSLLCINDYINGKISILHIPATSFPWRADQKTQIDIILGHPVHPTYLFLL